MSYLLALFVVVITMGLLFSIFELVESLGSFDKLIVSFGHYLIN